MVAWMGGSSLGEAKEAVGNSPRTAFVAASTCPGCCWQCAQDAAGSVPRMLLAVCPGCCRQCGHGPRWVKGVWGRSTCPRCCWQCSGHGPRWVKGTWGRSTCRRGCWQCNGYGPRWEVDPHAQEVAGSAMEGVLFQHPGMALGGGSLCPRGC